MFLIAHRGASLEAPENTLGSVRLAWEEGADVVEIDVHLSRDGHLVAIHDDNTRRTAGVKRKVVNQTLAELRRLDAGSWKDAKWWGERIPTLEEILATVPTGKRLFIEIKTRTDAARALARVFEKSGCQAEQIVLIGFSFPTMKALKRVFPKIEVCWIAELKRHPITRRWPDAAKLVRKIKAGGLDGVDLCANGAVTPALVKKIHSAGLNVYVWTVDTREQAMQMKRAGVDGITTNRPGWLRQQLSWV